MQIRHGRNNFAQKPGAPNIRGGLIPGICKINSRMNSLKDQNPGPCKRENAFKKQVGTENIRGF